MNAVETKRNEEEQSSKPYSKRVILSMGGKGGVGKTSVMAALAEWFRLNQIPARLLDLDSLCSPDDLLPRFHVERRVAGEREEGAFQDAADEGLSAIDQELRRLQ